VESEQRHQEKVRFETTNSKPPFSMPQVEKYDHKDKGLLDSEVGSSKRDATRGKGMCLLPPFGILMASFGILIE
jgi:hypothetical protein